MSVFRRVAHEIYGIGHGDVIFKTDRAPAMLDLQIGSREEGLNRLESISKIVKSLLGSDGDDVDAAVV